ncbi:phage baseplate assembly protein V [Pseudomonas zeae]|uniref:phage baseplate assembly protein V n=1 Tax=Pseudomonas zeae TaxID=2745510 RepID=UPI0039DFD0DD
MKPSRVKVKTGTLTTGWLPCIADRECPPTKTSRSSFSPSGQLGNGIVLAGLFSDNMPVNGDREGLHRTICRGGTAAPPQSHAGRRRYHQPVSTGGIRIVGPITYEGDYTHTGNQNVTDMFTVSEDAIAAGISLVKRLHGGVMLGGAKKGIAE